MSFWKRAGKVLVSPVTIPVKAARNTARLLKIRSRAEDVLETAEQAEEDPTKYRNTEWWATLLRQCAALWEVLPIPETLRMNTLLTNYKTTLGGIAMILAALTAIANDPSQILDPKVLGLIAGGYAAIVAKDHNVTGGTKNQ